MTKAALSTGLLRRAASATAAGALALAGAIALPASPAQADTTTSGDVIANLWEWNWNSIAAECTDVLGPTGYGAVQVAPPAESLKQPNSSWWDVYQPYSYNLNSRFGTAAQFTSMVSACHAAGVRVYVDAVINHTSAQTGTGYDGTTLTDKYDTPDYDYSDYHHPGDGYCSDEDGIIDDWSNLSEVQNCELLGLPDLRTGDDSVRSRIAGYLNKLLAAGVDGFRVDAAKHIAEADLAAIEAKLDNTAAGGAPYVFQEVYPGPTPQPGDYYASGDVLDFTYADRLKSAFQGNVSDLASLSSSGILPAADSVSFVTNHDTERNGLHLSYKDGGTYRLANIFELAWRWSAPTIFSGFEFSSSDQSPPNSGGFVTDTDCSRGWYCLHRDPAVAGMVKWHDAVGSQAVSRWATKSSDVIGFARGTAGYVALNNGSSAATYTFATGMADGRYANVVDNGATNVTVSGGDATLTIPAKSAIAFYDGAFTPCTTCGGGDGGGTSTVTATFHEYAPTTPGTGVYVVGSIPALGSWNTAEAVPLSSAGYPVWSGGASVPVNTSFEFKYIRKDASGNVTWESNANRSASTTTSALTVDSSWNLADANATDVTFHENATTGWGTGVYVVGSVPSLGSWNTADAIPLSSAAYPTWSRTVIVPRESTFAYKYVKKDASGNVTWESGTNRSYTTGGASGYTVNDTWK
ncbi:carbohydrate-binding module family 20 domain-containing protein [Streptomyces sp. MUM 2J]|uniref:carbohydrate-binding module family 20 domain-containing protein n=1 Tax=Streptomyces sp. MUM 2J TaxID=2791987 RepID=UPI001F04E56B|nr:carbohydrate-binding module family 20 domain-containing protein [Streptomyces sp. MUM 2J]MCH0565012.1 alpha-amylase [Streptomyces sp. MUM 2J]